VHAHTRTCSSFGSNAAAARAYRHSRLGKNSAGHTVTQNWKHFRGRRGPRRHVSRIRSNKLRGIGNRRGAAGRVLALAKPRTRVPARSLLCFPCPRVRAEAYTGALRCSRLCYDRYVLLGRPRRLALTTHNDATPAAVPACESIRSVLY